MSETTIESACGVPQCLYCTPTKIHHWRCTGCGGGPYKFQSSDPPTERPMKALRPYFVRHKAEWVQDGTSGHWERWTRYFCSRGCYTGEKNVITAELIDLQGTRPDLAESIQAQLEAEAREDGGDPMEDDLTPMSRSVMVKPKAGK